MLGFLAWLAAAAAAAAGVEFALFGGGGGGGSVVGEGVRAFSAHFVEVVKKD